ncbi:MAG: serine/threonine-protein kinase [Dehalococcoidia bacterium]
MVTFGRYEIRGTLGDGGAATVYRAWDTVLGRAVALKALHPQLAADPTAAGRFQAEAWALARLRHPAIVTVFDVGRLDGRPFYTMELIDGPTLAEIIPPDHGLDPVWVTDALRQLASAVDYIHAAGLVHRDIKAANVMIDRSGRVMLTDFGVGATTPKSTARLPPPHTAGQRRGPGGRGPFSRGRRPTSMPSAHWPTTCSSVIRRPATRGPRRPRPCATARPAHRHERRHRGGAGGGAGGPAGHLGAVHGPVHGIRSQGRASAAPATRAAEGGGATLWACRVRPVGGGRRRSGGAGRADRHAHERHPHQRGASVASASYITVADPTVVSPSPAAVSRRAAELTRRPPRRLRRGRRPRCLRRDHHGAPR